MSRFDADFDRAKQRIQSAARAAVHASGVELQSRIKGRLTRGGASNIGAGGASQSSRHLAVDTGTLRRSIVVDTTELETRNAIKVGSNLVYAPIHEFGGTITPKRVKYLPVPFPGMAKRAKQIRAAAGGSLRGANLDLVKSKRGNLLLVEKNEDRSFTPVFILKKSVRIPARPYMRPAFAESRDQVNGVFRRVFASAFGGAA